MVNIWNNKKQQEKTLNFPTISFSAQLHNQLSEKQRRMVLQYVSLNSLMAALPLFRITGSSPAWWNNIPVLALATSPTNPNNCNFPNPSTFLSTEPIHTFRKAFPTEAEVRQGGQLPILGGVSNAYTVVKEQAPVCARRGGQPQNELSCSEEASLQRIFRDGWEGA